jgi:salicylate hydroxylase
MLASAVDEWKRWALFTVPDDCEWHEGQIALLGDAAHAMLPFAAQGAGMAIEDAAVLAKCLAEGGSDATGVAAALKKYARQRRGRVTKIQRLAARQGRIYHMSGPMAAARDLFIRAMGGKRMLSRQDWIYDWRIS